MSGRFSARLEAYFYYFPPSALAPVGVCNIVAIPEENSKHRIYFEFSSDIFCAGCEACDSIQ
jgi:hypothetical protein